MYDRFFNNLFYKFCGDIYIIEFDLDSKCHDTSLDCQMCLGTGHVIKNIQKEKALIDKVSVDLAFPNVNKDKDFGKYYADNRIIYFSCNSLLDLSPNIKRMVLNIIDDRIYDLFWIEYLEPITMNNRVIYYKGSLASANINNSRTMKTILKLIGDVEDDNV